MSVFGTFIGYSLLRKGNFMIGANLLHGTNIKLSQEVAGLCQGRVRDLGVDDMSFLLEDKGHGSYFSMSVSRIAVNSTPAAA